MLSRNDILETIRMIDQQHLDIRTITMGISLLSCADSSAERACEKIYDKIMSRLPRRLTARPKMSALTLLAVFRRLCKRA